jgi:hypothetical protein
MAILDNAGHVKSALRKVISLVRVRFSHLSYSYRTCRQSRLRFASLATAAICAGQIAMGLSRVSTGFAGSFADQCGRASNSQRRRPARWHHPLAITNAYRSCAPQSTHFRPQPRIVLSVSRRPPSMNLLRRPRPHRRYHLRDDTPPPCNRASVENR